MIQSLSKLLRGYLTGYKQPFLFEPVSDISLPALNKTHLYIHVPFCRSFCPYCPYHKIRYIPELVERFIQALLMEVEMYRRRIGPIEVPSLYIGGGTPTLLIKQLEPVIDRIRKAFSLTGPIAIETNPEDVNSETIDGMKQCGVTQVSLGVQSFQRRLLKLIGRIYGPDILDDKISLLKNNFGAVNIDLIFAIPGQTKQELNDDIYKAINSGADQITAYPLFTFPHSSIGQSLRLNKIKMPSLFVRHSHYRTLYDNFLNAGFKRASVWSFIRGGAPRYSSVTRDQFIGLGPSAASFVPGVYYFNSFSLDTYIERNLANKLPVCLAMRTTKNIENYHWLYWRFYDTIINKQSLDERFPGGSKKLKYVLKISEGFGLLNEAEDEYQLTKAGSFWIHLLQNYVALRYVDKIWSQASQSVFPNAIEI